MPFSSGTFTLYTPGNPVVTGTTIASTWANNTLNDIATGLSTALLKDGSQTVTANIPMAGFKFTGLGAGSVAGNSLRYEQLFTAGTLTLLGALSVPGAATITGATTPQALLDISGASAGQIKFPASQNAAANVNTLDDYEEGTFVPTLGGTATYTIQTGTYTKIGNAVTIQIRLAVNSIGSGATGTISGLPFTSTAQAQSLCASYWTSSATSIVSLGAIVNASATTINMTAATAAVASVSNAANIFGNGTDVILGGTYYTAT